MRAAAQVVRLTAGESDSYHGSHHAKGLPNRFFSFFPRSLTPLPVRSSIAMMRWVLLAVLVVAISAAATLLVQNLPSSDVDSPEAAIASKSKDEGPPPVAVVEGDLTHHFKVMSLHTKGTHKWVIKNEGKGDLLLTGGKPSCSCTVLEPGEGKTKTVKPGDSFTVNIEWQGKSQGDFHKTAPILTNDPKRPQIVFDIQGSIQPPIVTVPGDPVIDMMTVSNDKDHEYFLVLLSPDRPETKVTKMSTSRPDMFELSQEPLGDAEKKQLKVEQGVKIKITTKPLAHLGPFNEEIVIRTDHPLQSEVRQLVTGRITGPITLVPETVRVNSINGSKGGSTGTTIWVVGQEKTNFEVEKAPRNLKVAIVPVDEKTKADASSRGQAYRMTISIRPGTPSGIISDPILLKTDNPMAKELTVPVYIQVLDET
jgi:hypothetical protein